MPIITVAIGFVSLAIGMDALGFVGELKLHLDVVGFSLGLIAATFSSYEVTYPTTRAALTETYGLSQAYVGLGFDVGGAADGAAQILLDESCNEGPMTSHHRVFEQCVPTGHWNPEYDSSHLRVRYDAR